MQIVSGSMPVPEENKTEIVTTGLSFSNLNGISIDVPSGPVDPNMMVPEKKKRKSNSTAIATSKPDIVTGEIVDNTPLDAYTENMYALKQTLAQIDELAADLKSDLDDIRKSRTMKGKGQLSSLLAGNLTNLLSTKVNTLREMDSNIKNSEDLKYKIQKDKQDTEAMNDDRRIQELYSAFVNAPLPQGVNRMQALGPQTPMNIIGSERYTPNEDAGYQHYLNNLTPEQNAMRYEGNPNVKQVVRFNPSTGQRSFDVIDMTTGQSIPNMPRRDASFLQDTTINTREGIARNVNLNETYPLIIEGQNNNQFSDY